MKQLLLMMVLTASASVGSLVEPFWGVLLYYTFATLRPQYLWKWALPVEWRWSLIAAAMVVLGIMLNLPRILVKARVNAVTALMTAYGLLLLASCITAMDPATAQHWGIEYAKLLLMGILGSLVIRRLWQVRLLALMILLTLGYVAWEINYLYLFNNRLDVFHHGYGGLDNNGAGLMLAIGIPFAFCFGVSADRLWQRVASWGLGLVMLHALLMTYSRGAMLSTVVGVIWLLIHYRARWQAAVITVALCLVISVMAGQEIRDRFISTSRFDKDKSAQSRLDSWASAWRIAWDYPLTGQGIRNSNRYTQNYGADKRGRTTHSQYLQIAADSGIPAVCVYVVMLVTAMVYLHQSRQVCITAQQRQGHHPGGTPPPTGLHAVSLYQVENIALACQAGLVIFAVDGVFLSLEVFELPWLLIVIAGLLPGVIRVQLAESSAATREGDPSEPDAIHPRPGLDTYRPFPPTAAPQIPGGLPYP